MCGVTPRSRSCITKSRASQPRSAASVTGPAVGSRSSIHTAASRSAGARATSGSTTRPCRFSISTCPTKHSFRLLPRAVQPGIGVSGRSIVVAGAPLAAQVAAALAAVRRRCARLALGPEALHRGPGLDQAAVDAEVLARHQAAHPRLIQQLGQERGGRVARQQPVAALREVERSHTASSMPRPTNPAEQQVEVQPLHELAFRADRVGRLQRESLQQLLGRDRGRPIRGYGGRASHASVPPAPHWRPPGLVGSGCAAGTRSSRSTYLNNAPTARPTPALATSRQAASWPGGSSPGASFSSRSAPGGGLSGPPQHGVHGWGWREGWRGAPVGAARIALTRRRHPGGDARWGRLDRRS